MGSRYLTDLADVVRGAGLPCHEASGWQSNGRSSGGFDPGQPTYIVCHHTASGPDSDGWSDATYIGETSDIAPIAQLYLDRSGAVYVVAGGACNNAGSGGPLGSVPQDGMNTRSIAIEAANGGTGEVWPDVQQSAYVRLVGALCAHYAVPAWNVVAHFEWAPGRKIDPAGNSDYATGGASWDMDAFRADVTGPPPVLPPSSAPTFPGTARVGDKGAHVLEWQQAYIAKDVIADNPANHDAYYGTGMEAATYELQQSFGWKDADGVAGEHTWLHLQTDPCERCGL